MHPHLHLHCHLTRKQLFRLFAVLLVAVIAVEALVARHMLSGHDVFTGTLVVTAWFRDAFTCLLEHLAEDVAETV